MLASHGSTSGAIGDADQHTGAVGEQVEEIRVAVDERHQLAELGEDSEREAAQDDGPDRASRRSDAKPENRQDDEDPRRGRAYPDWELGRTNRLRSFA